MSAKRKLAAILAADAVGYSKLMADDEAETLRVLNEARSLFRRRIEDHGGHLIDTAGDSVLAEFPSAVETVNCAVEIQRELAKRNAQFAEHRRMQFRIGINLGDVLEQEDGTIYGDGVNVAARLQQLGEPGGIWLSGTAFDQVEGKLPLRIDFGGEQSVKNISKPVRTYRVVLDREPASPMDPRIKGRRLMFVAITAVLVIGVAAAALWPLRGKFMPAGLAGSGQALIDARSEPSIAVLPFANLNADPKDNYFADGITEDIITSLSKIDRLLVIARNSTFQYKGKSVDVRQVGHDLGVHHVLEGSVRKDRKTVRVTAQLINAQTGTHIWSERYDRPLQDIFAVQDDITRGIVDALQIQMLEGEQARVWRRTTKNVEAYQHFIRGREQILRFTKEDFALAKENLEAAISLDPKFAMAYTQLVSVPLLSLIMGISEDPPRDLEWAFALAKKAVELDDSQGYSLVHLGRIHMQIGELDKAIEYGKRAVAVEPNGSTTLAIYAHMLEAAGRCEEALIHVNKSLRLAPIPEAWIPWLQGLCLRKLGRYEEAIQSQERAISLAPAMIWYHVFLVDAYVAASRQEEAEAKAREVLRMDPGFTVDSFLKLFVWYKDPNTVESYRTNLRKAKLK
jgi:adenylate cyclase